MLELPFFAECGRNCGQWRTCLILNIFIQSLKTSEIGPNFACFWPLKFFLGGGGPLEILDLIFKILSTTDHGAKFRANQLMELRDTVVNK